MEDKEKQFTAEELEAAKQEAINKANSDHEAGVQKLIAEKKFAESVLEAVGEVAKDSENLITIFDKTPDVAKAILDKYYGGKSIEEYKESIGYKEDQSVVNEKLIETKAKSIFEANKVLDEKKAFIEKTWLTGEALEAFESEFWERLQLKSFSVDKLDEHLIKAYKLATGYSDKEVNEIKKTKIIAESVAISGWEKQKAADKSKIKSEVDDLLDWRI